MTENQIQLVKSSWSHVATELDDMAKLFAKSLVKLKPEFRPILQKLSAEKRLNSIMVTVSQLTSSLADLKRAEKDVMLLVAGYADINITKEDYDTALIAFLMALEKKIGKKWTLATRDAWIFSFVTVYQYYWRYLNKPVTLLKAS